MGNISNGPISEEAHDLAMYCVNNQDGEKDRIEWGRYRSAGRRATIFVGYVSLMADKYNQDFVIPGINTLFTSSDILQAAQFVCEYYERYPR